MNLSGVCLDVKCQVESVVSWLTQGEEARMPPNGLKKIPPSQVCGEFHGFQDRMSIRSRKPAHRSEAIPRLGSFALSGAQDSQVSSRDARF